MGNTYCHLYSTQEWTIIRCSGQSFKHFEMQISPYFQLSLIQHKRLTYISVDVYQPSAATRENSNSGARELWVQYSTRKRWKQTDPLKDRLRFGSRGAHSALASSDRPTNSSILCLFDSKKLLHHSCCDIRFAFILMVWYTGSFSTCPMNDFLHKGIRIQ